MPSIEEEALALSKREDGEVDFERFQAEYDRIAAERNRELMFDARAVFRAMDGWGAVRSQDDWQKTVERSHEEYQRGKFLVDRLGAERYLDPELMATLLSLRRGLIEGEGADSAADMMLVDCALLSYYHFLRMNGWIGNFASLIEHEFFRKESMTAKLRKEYGYGVEGLKVDEYIHRVGEELLPLLDRCNRMMIRNLRALRERKAKPVPNVTIGSAGQVNMGAQVAAQQVSAAAVESGD
jgi:hypothetical protein